MSDYVFAWTAYGVSFAVLFFAFLPVIFKVKWLFVRYFLILSILLINAAFVSFDDGADAPLLAALAIEAIAGNWHAFAEHQQLLLYVFAAAAGGSLILTVVIKKMNKKGSKKLTPKTAEQNTQPAKEV